MLKQDLMKTSINKFIYKYIFLYGIFFTKPSTSTIIKNKSLLEILSLKDNKENEKYLSDMINTNTYSKKIYLNPLNIITGGVPKFILWETTKLIFNNSNLFINKDILIKYGEFQRNKLIDFLTDLEDNKEKIVQQIENRIQ